MDPDLGEDAEAGSADAPLLNPGITRSTLGYSAAYGLSAERPTKTITHQDSVYSFALFVPPLTRKKEGHYCTGNVLLAFSLLVLTATTQLSLSQIVGSYITDQSKTFKVSLIRNQHWMSTAITPLDFASDWVTDKVSRVSNKLPWASEKNESTATMGTCCDNAECTSAMRCCTPSEKKHLLEGKSRRVASFFEEMPMMKTVQVNGSGKGRFASIFGDDGGIALCRREADDGEMDCSPPSYAYMHTWEELDANGDGVWTVEEAKADITNLGCRLGLSTVDFFHSAIRGIIKDARDTAGNSFVIPLVPLSIEKRHAIPRDYFRWYTGIINLCLTFDVSRCSQLVDAGFFDGAIGQQKEADIPGLRGGIHDLDSSLDYCQRMLRPNGICEQTLPHTYLLYRARVSEKCGEPSYTVSGKHINPHDPRDAMSIVEVSFDEHSSYIAAQEWKFQVFLGLILLVWYVTLVLEISRIIDFFDFLWNVKTAEKSSFSFISPQVRQSFRSTGLGRLIVTPRDFAPSLQRNESGGELLPDLSRFEKYTCWGMWFIRLFLWWYMANVGTTFLLASFAYDDLLFNAVALAFIFELQEFLYVFLVSDENKKMLKDAETAPFSTSLPVEGWKSVMMSRAFWGLVLIPVFVWIVLHYNMYNNLLPSSEALDCACFQSGPHCNSARSFEKEWWETYWKDTLHLARLRASYFGPR